MNGKLTKEDIARMSQVERRKYNRRIFWGVAKRLPGFSSVKGSLLASIKRLTASQVAELMEYAMRQPDALRVDVQARRMAK